MVLAILRIEDLRCLRFFHVGLIAGCDIITSVLRLVERIPDLTNLYYIDYEEGYVNFFEGFTSNLFRWLVPEKLALKAGAINSALDVGRGVI